MTYADKRVLAVVCSGLLMVLSLGTFVLYAANDWLLTSTYLLVVHRSFVALLLLAPLLTFFGAAWCAAIAVQQPELVTRRTFAGAGLLLGSLLPGLFLGVPVVLIGYLGMPRRYYPAPHPWQHFVEWAAIPIASLVVGATGVWLLVSKRSVDVS